jgi:hypothetical protein
VTPKETVEQKGPAESTEKGGASQDRTRTS